MGKGKTKISEFFPLFFAPFPKHFGFPNTLNDSLRPLQIIDRSLKLDWKI